MRSPPAASKGIGLQGGLKGAGLDHLRDEQNRSALLLRQLVADTMDAFITA